MPDPYSRRGVRAPDSFRRPWLKSEGVVARRVVAPAERFLRLEAGSGFLLLVAAAAALVWANVSPGGYEAAWHTEVSLQIGSLELDEDLRHWINDLLMALFFCMIALEVKREYLFGELRERSVAIVPVAAAIGGMVVPALVYLAINAGGQTDGWAIPLATDVAFALAVLATIGRLAPSPLRAFLLTVAIVDDIGTIVVIALFYSGGLALGWLAAAVGVTLGIVVMQRLAVRHLAPYVLAAGLLWLAVFESGVHGTIAGVIVGLLTPARAFHPPRETGEAIATQIQELEESSDAAVGERAMHETSRLALEATSPLKRVEEALHPWTAYAVLPLFALANAGVPISVTAMVDTVTEPVGVGIVLGLVVGKPLGLLLGSLVAVKAGGARLPRGADWSSLAALGALAGIGFTVALFISALALDGADLEQAKLAILLASVLAAAVSAVVFGIRHLARR
jgi:NhaA family Na+:H+ antiporter